MNLCKCKCYYPVEWSGDRRQLCKRNCWGKGATVGPGVGAEPSTAAGGSNKAEQRGDAEGWRGAYVEVLRRLYEEADILEYEVETACE